MAPKRAAPPAPASPRKRTSSRDQPLLAAFLSGSAQAQAKGKAREQRPEAVPEHDAAARPATPESDEQMARRLQQEWDAADSAALAVKGEQSSTGAGTGAVDAVKSEPTAASGSGVRIAPLFQSPKKPRAEKTEPSIKAEAQDARSAVEEGAGSWNAAPESSFYGALDALDLTQDPFEFDPTALDTSAWPRTSAGATAAPYRLLSIACASLSGTRSRILISNVCVNTLRILIHHDAAAVAPAAYLLSNHIAPPYEGIEMGIGGSVITAAVKEVTGVSAQRLKSLWNAHGDPGDVAYEARRGVKSLMQPAPLTIVKLFEQLHAMARMSGTGSAAQKRAVVTRLLVAARDEETRFLVRTLDGNLRIRAVRTTIAAALARAFVLDGPQSGREGSLSITRDESSGLRLQPAKPKERENVRWKELSARIARAERTVREVRARCPDFTRIAAALSAGGIDELSERVPLRIGTPLAPMLGSITRSLPDMHSRLGPRKFVSEFKYDGQRVQIHACHVPRDAEDADRRRAELKGGKGRWVGQNADVFVRLFSRHLEDITDKYPDILDAMPILMGVDSDAGSSEVPKDAPRRAVQSFVVDAEVVALGPNGELLPFQTLASRGRKDVALASVKVRVGIFAFDLMLLDGQQLLKKSFRVRRKLLHTRLPTLTPADARLARFTHVRSCEATEPDEVKKFFDEARSSKCEGIMVKSLDHHWAPAAEANSEGDDEAAAPKLEQLADEVGDDVTQADLDTAEPDVELSTAVGKGVNGRGKALLSSYEPDKRCESWLKVKKDYVDGIGDTLDLVPIGAWHGMGRKNEWWSPVLLATYDPDTGQYVALCKCISGFTDVEYKSIKFDRFKLNGDACYDARAEDCRHDYDTGGLRPDVWFEPREVWEIRGADITLSPVYNCAKGLISPARGLSLRFPRFLKVRDSADKGPEEATTPRMMANLYLSQNEAGAIPGEAVDEEEEE